MARGPLDDMRLFLQARPEDLTLTPGFLGRAPLPAPVQLDGAMKRDRNGCRPERLPELLPNEFRPIGSLGF